VKSGKLLGFVVSNKGIEVDPDKVKAIQDMPAPKTERRILGHGMKIVKKLSIRSSSTYKNHHC
jgi:hypothetical protein